MKITYHDPVSTSLNLRGLSEVVGVAFVLSQRWRKPPARGPLRKEKTRLTGN
ncbi:hypothetical protein [Chamaesiphon minutus]|uniref:hypothetical protein n=1 Tax=Chamaesiphon minutus TaxID=1173032 RepID=UPI0003198AA6|nr:hypothetical protein [Chamaesiphon minutus]